MARGSRLGSIYVQVSLDDKVYNEKLAAMPANAQATAKGLEKSWSALGVKTNEYFDNSRKAAENAYKLIEKSGKYSADEIARAEKAKNDKINQYNEQQFGKTEGLLTKLKNNWVVAAASITAAYMAAQKAWNLADQAAKYEQSAVAFHTMATSMGKDATAEFDKIRTASKGLIDEKSLTEATNKALSLGIPLESIADLMEIAQAKSRDMGTTTQQAFSDIATGVGRASPLILDNLGLVMKVGTANDELAKKLGKSTAELTDQEKKTAILNATLEAGKEAVARYNLEQLTTAERMQALQTTVTNLQLMLGQGIIRAAAGAVGAFQSIEAASVTVSAGIWKIIETYYKFRAAFSWGDVSKEFTEQANAARANAEADMKAASGYWKSAKNNFDSMTATTADMAKAIGGVAPIAKKVGDTTVSAANNSKKAIEDLAKENAKRVAKAIEDEEKWRKKFEDVNSKLETDTKDTYDKIYNIKQTDYDKEINRIGKLAGEYEDQGADREKLAKWVTSQIELAEKNLNDKTIKYWQGQEDEWVATMKAETDAAAAANTKQIQYIEKFNDAMNDAQDELDYTAKTSIPKLVTANSTLWDDMKKGWKNAEKQCGTFATNAESVFRSFVSETSGAIGDSLFDFIKGETDSLEDVWQTWCDNILKSFTDAVGDMATSFLMDGMKKMVQYAKEPISMVVSAAWDAASAIVLAGIKALQSFFAWEGGYVRSSGIGAYAYGGNVVPGYASGGDSKSNDTVLAWLSPGEYVMPRTAVNAETLPHLEYMRENKRPRGYASGGYVDQLPGLTQSWTGDMHWYDDDEWEGLEDVYKMIHDYAGLTYYNGQWGRLGFKTTDEGSYPVSFAPVADAIIESGKYLNEKFNYNLQDENIPPQALDAEDYKYLLNWFGASINPLGGFGWGEGGDWSWDQEHGFNPITGSWNPNVVWTEPEGDGYRFYMRDGSDYWADASESNFLKRFMPSIIKIVGAVAAVAIATAAALPTGGQSYTALAGITAAIEGGMASAAGIAGAIGAGAYSALVTYGETGSVTGSLIAGIIAAAATALSFGSPWGQSETGLMVLKSEMEAGGYLTAAQGRVIADVIRKGGGAVLQETINSVAGGGGSMALEKSGSSGGLGEMEALYNALPGMMSGSYSLASGLDYVPYDNFPARLHKGEAVLTAEENKSGRGDIILNFNLNGTVIDRKAVNEFAELIYPRLQKLQAWGH